MGSSLTDWRDNIQTINLNKIIAENERRPHTNPLNFTFPPLRITSLKRSGRGSTNFYRFWRSEIEGKILDHCNNQYALVAWPEYVVNDIEKQSFSVISVLRSRVNNRVDATYQEMRRPGSEEQIARRGLYFFSSRTQNYLVPYVLKEIPAKYYTWDVSSEKFNSTLTRFCSVLETLYAGIWASRQYRDNVIDHCIIPRGYAPLKKCASFGEIIQYLDKMTSGGRWDEEQDLALHQQQQPLIEADKKKPNKSSEHENKLQEMEKRWQKYHAIHNMMSAFDNFNDALQSPGYRYDEVQSNELLQNIDVLGSNSKNKTKENGFPEFWTTIALDLILRLKLSMNQRIGDNSSLNGINGDDVNASGLPLVMDYFDEIVDGTPIKLSKACNVIDKILGEVPTRNNSEASSSKGPAVKNINGNQGAAIANGSADASKTRNNDNNIPLSERLQPLPLHPRTAAPSPSSSTPQPTSNSSNNSRKRAADEMDNSKKDQVKAKDNGNSIEIIGTSEAKSKARSPLQSDSAGADKPNNEDLSDRITITWQQSVPLSKPAPRAPSEPAAMLLTKAPPAGPASTKKLEPVSAPVSTKTPVPVPAPVSTKTPTPVSVPAPTRTPAPVSVPTAEPELASASSSSESEEDRLGFVNDDEDEQAAEEDDEENERDGVLSLSDFSKTTNSATILPNFVGIASTRNSSRSSTPGAATNNKDDDDDDDDSFLLETMRRKKMRLF